jgi:hypothetical protein
MPVGAPKGNTNAKKAEAEKKQPRRLVVTLSLADERLAWVTQALIAEGQPVTDAAIRRFVRRMGYDALDTLMQQSQHIGKR